MVSILQKEWIEMLLSWVLTLQPEEPVTVPTNLGRAAHAWFLDQVRAADASLADELHSGQGLRPFTTSNIWELGRARRPEAELDPARTYTLRFTSFSPQLSALLKDQILPDLPEAIRLADAPLRVMTSTANPAEHDWAAEATFEGLVQRHTLSASIPRSVGLRFASPTAFRVTGKKRAVPLPLPQLVFGGLLDRWNTFSPIQVHPDVRRFAEERLVISSYRLSTRRVAFGEQGQRGTYSGFTGFCRYYVEQHDRYWTGLIQLLAGFSLYASVGLRTTMGLGQARMMEKREGR
jgi:CRISPR-associated endoribonuclease Cas6